MLFKLLFFVLCGATYAFITENTISLNTELTVELEFSDDGRSFKNVSCTAISSKVINGWQNKVVYYRDETLDKSSGLMIEANFDEEGKAQCRTVPSTQDKQIKEKVSICFNQCRIDNKHQENEDNNISDTNNSGDKDDEEERSNEKGEGESTVSNEDKGKVEKEINKDKSGSDEEGSEINDNSSPKKEDNATKEENKSPDKDTQVNKDINDSKKEKEDSTKEDNKSNGEMTKVIADEKANKEEDKDNKGKDYQSDTPIKNEGGKGDGNGLPNGKYPCGEGYTYIEALKSCYLFSNYTAQWYDGECACARHGGTLAIINNMDEQKILSGLLKDSTWIGLNDQTIEGEFLWRDGSALNFTKWAVDSINTNDKDCVEMSANYNYTWLSQRCDAQKKFLCEVADPNKILGTGVCPDGWKKDLDTGFCYYVSITIQNWDNSNKVCSDVGGSLASIHSTEDSAFIRGLQLKSNLWIGLKDQNKNGNFTFTDNSPMAYTNWAEGTAGMLKTLASMIFYSDKYCVELKSDQKFMWNVNSCAETRNALCTRKSEILPRSKCPNVFESDGAGSCFMVSKLQTDFATAGKLCAQSAVGAELAIPTTTAHETCVSGLLKKSNTVDVWLGMNVGNAISIQGSASLNLRGIVNLLTGKFSNADCVRLNTDGKWYGKSCTTKYNYVCVTSQFKSTTIEGTVKAPG